MTGNAMKGYLESLRVGDPIECQNLTVVPLLGGLEAVPDYQTLDEALSAKTLAVSEVSAGGHVPELAVQNSGTKNVLMLDGEELVGAKQNRILNLTLLVAANSKQTIPVSCVEQGRWRSMSANFESGHYAPANLRNNKERSVRENLRACNVPASDQGQVWNDVESTLHEVCASSPTMAMSDAYRHHETNLRESAAAIRLPADACGIAAFVGTELVVVDLFGYQATFQQVSRKLVDSYVLAAVAGSDGPRGRKKASSVPDFRKQVAETLERATVAPGEQRPSVGLGTDVRLSGTGVRGAALVYEDSPLHASLFPDNGGDEPSAHGRSTRMASPRRRQHGQA